jgi:hypothetical protein
LGEIKDVAWKVPISDEIVFPALVQSTHIDHFDIPQWTSRKHPRWKDADGMFVSYDWLLTSSLHFETPDPVLADRILLGAK